jgi:K+-sensing histidine kinase KdpD
MNRVVKMRHYGVAVIACGVALIVARPLSAASSCFLLAIIVSSLFGGRGPGLLAVGLSATAFNLFFLPSPVRSRAIHPIICVLASFSPLRSRRAY